MDSVAWAAGFLDGEGCFWAGVVKNRSKPSGEDFHIRIIAVQTVRAPLDVLQRLFGGVVKPLNAPSLADNRQTYEWRLSGATAVLAALEKLKGHLIVKAPEAQVMMDLASGIAGKRGPITDIEQQRRRRLTSELKHLKRAA